MNFGKIFILPMLFIFNLALLAQNSQITAQKKKILEIHRKIPLKINNLVLCYQIKSFGNYERVYNNEIPQDEEIVIYYEIEGIHTYDFGKSLRYSLAHTIEIYAYNHNLVKSFKNCLNIDKIVDGLPIDFYISQKINFINLAIGTYFLKVILYDRLKEKSTTAEIKFKIIQ